MTDNRTTELREKLTERGVEWRAREEELELRLEGFYDTRWNVNCVHWCYTEFVNRSTCLTMCNEWKDCTPEQAIAATLGSGTMTANDVLNAVYKHGARWQAIADELNAMLGSGECEWVLEHSGTLYDKWRCSECSYLFVESRTDQGIKEDFEPNYCPNCGKAVK